MSLGLRKHGHATFLAYWIPSVRKKKAYLGFTKLNVVPRRILAGTASRDTLARQKTLGSCFVVHYPVYRCPEKMVS